jgi:electron transport complex protein RnfE
MSKLLGPYVPLIIVNCMIISRCEVCSSKQGPKAALADGFGVSLGFLLALASVATVREILGNGSWFGIQLVPESFPTLILMILPPGAFLALGSLLGLATWIGHRREARAGKPETESA